MAYDCRDKKTSRMSYADLFKSSSWNQSMSSWESSSLSDFSSPLGSELASSSESDDGDGDFAFELSRQMAEVMLQEEDEQETEREESPFPNEASGHVKKSNLNYGHGLPPLEVYQLRNQPPTAEAGHARQKTEHRHHHNYYRQQKQCHRGRYNAGQIYGSGMRAVFLGGNGSGHNGSSGTGVFLPRSANDSTSVKKPQTGGCSTVLIPTRVLHALELHFNRLQESKAHQPPSGEYHNQSCFQDEYSMKSQKGLSHELENKYDNNDKEDMRLPQEWTY